MCTPLPVLKRETVSEKLNVHRAFVRVRGGDELELVEGGQYKVHLYSPVPAHDEYPQSIENIHVAALLCVLENNSGECVRACVCVFVCVYLWLLCAVRCLKCVCVWCCARAHLIACAHTNTCIQTSTAPAPSLFPLSSHTHTHTHPTHTTAGACLPTDTPHTHTSTQKQGEESVCPPTTSCVEFRDNKHNVGFRTGVLDFGEVSASPLTLALSIAAAALMCVVLGACVCVVYARRRARGRGGEVGVGAGGDDRGRGNVVAAARARSRARLRACLRVRLPRAPARANTCTSLRCEHALGYERTLAYALVTFAVIRARMCVQPRKQTAAKHHHVRLNAVLQ